MLFTFSLPLLEFPEKHDLALRKDSQVPLKHNYRRARLQGVGTIKYGDLLLLRSHWALCVRPLPLRKLGDLSIPPLLEFPETYYCW